MFVDCTPYEWYNAKRERKGGIMDRTYQVASDARRIDDAVEVAAATVVAVNNADLAPHPHCGLPVASVERMGLRVGVPGAFLILLRVVVTLLKITFIIQRQMHSYIYENVIVPQTETQE